MQGVVATSDLQRYVQLNSNNARPLQECLQCFSVLGCSGSCYIEVSIHYLALYSGETSRDHGSPSFALHHSY